MFSGGGEKPPEVEGGGQDDDDDAFIPGFNFAPGMGPPGGQSWDDQQGPNGFDGYGRGRGGYGGYQDGEGEDSIPGLAPPQADNGGSGSVAGRQNGPLPSQEDMYPGDGEESWNRGGRSGGGGGGGGGGGRGGGRWGGQGGGGRRPRY